jgi:CRISPR-associated endonuclease/helicase Cas3
MADWLCWLDPIQSRMESRDVQPHLPLLLADKAQQQGLRNFVQSQVAVTSALFSFRDSFQGPTAVLYDPTHFFSSQTINRYDLFHLLRNYRLSPPMSRSHFIQNCAETDLIGDFYVALHGEREAKLVIEFVYDTEDERGMFEQKWCGLPVALSGLRLQAREAGGDIIGGALDQQIITTLVETYQPVLIIPPDSVGVAIARLRNSSLWAQRLTVYFPDGTLNEDYRAYLGTAAFQAHAELMGHFLLKDRLKTEAIIL